MGSLIPRTAPGSKRTKLAIGGPAIVGMEKLIQKIDPEPEIITLPPPEPPKATPDAQGAGDVERRRIRRRSGRREAFLTGNLVPQSTKKTTLG